MAEFIKQGSEPLFPDVLWNRPVNKKAAKKLLIIGGHSKQFKNTQAAYLAAQKAGIGEVKIVMPDVLKKIVGPLDDALFVPSTQSGSIAKEAIDEVKIFADDSDGVLLVGELSQNTDTISFLESVLSDIDKPIALTSEILSSMLFNPNGLIAGDNRLVVTSTQGLVKLMEALDLPFQLQADQNLLNKVALLKQLYDLTHTNLALLGAELLIASEDKVSLSLVSHSEVVVATYLTVFWLQTTKAFEALTTAAFELSKA